MANALTEPATAPGGSPVRPRGVLATALPAPEGWESGGVEVSVTCPSPVVRDKCISMTDTASRPNVDEFPAFMIEQGSTCSTLTGTDREAEARSALEQSTDYALGLNLATGVANGATSLADATNVNPATSEVQEVTITGSPTGGTFTLTYAGETTAAIAYNATATEVQSALEALPGVDVGDVAVTGGPGPDSPWTVTFVDSGDVPQMTATGSFTGGTSPDVTVTTVTQGETNPFVDAVAAVAALECAAASAGEGEAYVLHATPGAAAYLVAQGMISDDGLSPSGVRWIVSAGYQCDGEAPHQIWATGRVWAAAGQIATYQDVERRQNNREAWAVRSAVVGFNSCINLTATFTV